MSKPWGFLFLLLCLTRPVDAATGTVTVDYNTVTGFGTPFLFGVCKFPLKAQETDIYPKLKDAGVVYLRADFFFEIIIPPTKCASVADYKNNVHDIQNPGNWNYDQLYWIDDSRKFGLKTFVNAVYVPAWLSCSGNSHGPPRDWEVWEDIVRKVFARYKTRVDWFDVWNEVEYACDLTGSPYQDKEDFLVDYFYHTVKAVREAGGKIPTGGFSFACEEPEMFPEILRRMVAKYGQAWTSANFNFYSVHHYGGNPGTINVGDIRTAFLNAGLNPNRPIFINEWNYTADWVGSADELHTAKAIGYVGKSLAKFVKAGVNATYFCAYPSQAILTNTVYEDGHTTTLGFYTANGSTATLLPQAYPFKLLSNRLGLGRGNFRVCAIPQQSLIDACAVINSQGQRVAFVANYYNWQNLVNLTIKGLPGRQVAITEYWANSWDPNCPAWRTVTNAVSDGVSNYSMNMLANTCLGLVFSPVETNNTASTRTP